MNFNSLVMVLVELEKTNSRNLMTEILGEFLKTVGRDEISRTMYLLLGQLGPLYERIDFGLADKMVVRSLAMAADRPASEILAEYKRIGDLGEVAGKNVDQRIIIQKQAGLSVGEVYEQLLRIAQASGKGSQEEKIKLLAKLLLGLDWLERKYVVRIVLGKMRLGFSDKTMLDALAVMDGGNKPVRNRLELGYQMRPDIGKIGELVKEVGAVNILEYVNLSAGVPVMPALAQRLKTADEMIKKMGKVMVEPKFDGTRIQIHFDKDKNLLKSFTRSLEENSAMFPEMKQVMEQIKADSLIIDCEAVGYDPVSGEMRSFQETITRKRKHNVESVSKTVPIRFNCFDILLLNGESLLDRPLFERRKLLLKVVGEGETLVVDDYMVTDSADELREYHRKQLELGLEGAMVKQYDGIYQPGRTGWNWVKFKEVEEADGKLSDTVDGVVMGYYRGRGKRSKFGIGAFLLGIRDDNEVIVSVAKIGTGLTDEQWKEMRDKVDSNFAMSCPGNYRVPDGLVPDVWADPKIVVEIAADEITKSPLHSSGYGLRFPRLVRFREDKLVNQATTVQELESIK